MQTKTEAQIVLAENRRTVRAVLEANRHAIERAGCNAEIIGAEVVLTSPRTGRHALTLQVTSGERLAEHLDGYLAAQSRYEDSIRSIAHARLGRSLVARSSDGADFFEISVWDIDDMLRKAYAAGRDAAR